MKTQGVFTSALIGILLLTACSQQENKADLDSDIPEEDRLVLEGKREESGGFSVRGGTVSEVNLLYNGAFTSVGYLRTASAGIYCTATLVRPNVLLTAAHCVTGFRPQDVRFSVVKTSVVNTEVAATRFLVPFDSTGKRIADLAVVKLAKNYIDQLNSVQQHALKWGPQANADGIVELSGTPLNANTPAAIIGYGIDEKGSFGIRKRGNVKVTRYVRSGTEYFVEAVPADAKNQISCPGDSGSPLLVKRKKNSADIEFGGLNPTMSPGMEHVIAGVTSFVTATNTSTSVNVCKTTSSAYYVPIDIYKSVITQMLSAI